MGILTLMPEMLSAGTLEISHFKYIRDIKAVSAPPSGAMLSVRLDDEVFLSTGDNYRDLAVIDNDDSITPSIVRPVTRSIVTATTRAIDLSQIEKKETDDGTIELVYEKANNRQSNFLSEMTFVSESKDYEMLISVFDSLNGTVWTPLTRGQPVFDYSSCLGISRTTVRVPENRSLFFKVVISPLPNKNLSPLHTIAKEYDSTAAVVTAQRKAIADSTFSLSSIVFTTRKMQRTRTARLSHPYRVDAIDIHQDKNTKTTVITFDSVGGPVTELSMSILDKNFSRSVRVEGSRDLGDTHNWKEVCESRIRSINIAGFSERRTTISFDGPRYYRKYRLTISNGDLEPIRILDVQAYGEIHEIVFPSSPDHTYRLAYDACSHIEVTRLSDPPEENKDIITCMLGPERNNPAYRPARPLPPALCRFGIPIIAATALIMLAAMFRRRSIQPQ